MLDTRIHQRIHLRTESFSDARWISEAESHLYLPFRPTIHRNEVPKSIAAQLVKLDCLGTVPSRGGVSQPPLDSFFCGFCFESLSSFPCQTNSPQTEFNTQFDCAKCVCVYMCGDGKVLWCVRFATESTHRTALWYWSGKSEHIHTQQTAEHFRRWDGQVTKDTPRRPRHHRRPTDRPNQVYIVVIVCYCFECCKSDRRATAQWQWAWRSSASPLVCVCLLKKAPRQCRLQKLWTRINGSTRWDGLKRNEEGGWLHSATGSVCDCANRCRHMQDCK